MEKEIFSFVVSMKVKLFEFIQRRRRRFRDDPNEATHLKYHDVFLPI